MIILVAGTNGWNPRATQKAWCDPGSDFARFLEAEGFSVAFGAAADGSPRPFVWSTDVGGVGFGDGDLKVWHAAGLNLYSYIIPPLYPRERIAPADTKIIAHSHGLQVVLFACAAGLKVDTLLSLGSPIREDMQATTSAARPNIRRWVHVHSDGSDWWQWLGALFDGNVGIVRAAARADENIAIPKVGHTDLLNKPEHQDIWRARLLPALRG